MDLISIVVPVYNAEKYISDCIKSLCNQTYTNIEIILVNDGSTDSSLKICHLYAEMDNRIQIINQRNQGVSAARNAGIYTAEGVYLTFVDADDYVMDNYCDTLIGLINSKNVDCVYCGQYSLYDGQVIKIKSRKKNGSYQTSDILKIDIDDGNMSGFLLHSACAVLYKLEIIRTSNILFDESIRYNEDGFFNLLYCLNSYSIYINQNICNYIYRKDNENSATHNNISTEEKYTILHTKIRELAAMYPEYDFELQLKKRQVTLAIEQINQSLYLPMSQCTKIIIEICKQKKICEGINVISTSELDLNKKIIYFLLKKRRVYTLYFVQKYLIPNMKRMLKR